MDAAPAVWQAIAGILIFLISLVLIISGVIHRAYAAWGGAILMLLLGVISVSSAWGHHFIWQPVLLYLGLMIMSGITMESGLIACITVKWMQKTKGKPFPLAAGFMILAAAGAALMDPISMILVLAPLTLTLAKKLGVTPIPFLVPEMLGANLGGTVTLIGSVPNLLAGTVGGLSFNDFWLYLIPIVVLVLSMTLVVIRLWYAGTWRAQSVTEEELSAFNASSFIVSKPKVYKVASVWLLVIAGFITAQPVLHLSLEWVSLAGASAMLLLCWRDTRWKETVASVDWGTLAFLLGLFLLVGGLTNVGVYQKIAVFLMELTSGHTMYITMILLWVSGLASATLDPVAYTSTIIPVIHELIGPIGQGADGSSRFFWLSTVLGVGLGSNATLLGSAANMIAARISMREGYPLTYMQFMKIGGLITLLSLLMASAYVLLVWL